MQACLHMHMTVHMLMHANAWTPECAHECAQRNKHWKTPGQFLNPTLLFFWSLLFGKFVEWFINTLNSNTNFVKYKLEIVFHIYDSNQKSELYYFYFLETWSTYVAQTGISFITLLPTSRVLGLPITGVCHHCSTEICWFLFDRALCRSFLDLLIWN